MAPPGTASNPTPSSKAANTLTTCARLPIWTLLDADTRTIDELIAWPSSVAGAGGVSRSPGTRESDPARTGSAGDSRMSARFNRLRPSVAGCGPGGSVSTARRMRRCAPPRRRGRGSRARSATGVCGHLRDPAQIGGGFGDGRPPSPDSRSRQATAPSAPAQTAQSSTRPTQASPAPTRSPTPDVTHTVSAARAVVTIKVVPSAVEISLNPRIVSAHPHRPVLLHADREPRG